MTSSKDPQSELEQEANRLIDPDQKFEIGKAFGVLFRLILIAPFNLIVLFLPGLFTFLFLCGVWGFSLGLCGAAIGVMGMLKSVVLLQSTWATIAAIAAALSVLASGVVSGMLSYAMTKFALVAAIDYLKWNAKFVTED